MDRCTSHYAAGRCNTECGHYYTFIFILFKAHFVMWKSKSHTWKWPQFAVRGLRRILNQYTDSDIVFIFIVQGCERHKLNHTPRHCAGMQTSHTIIPKPRGKLNYLWDKRQEGEQTNLSYSLMRVKHAGYHSLDMRVWVWDAVTSVDVTDSLSCECSRWWWFTATGSWGRQSVQVCAGWNVQIL